jgi:subtilisin family serine protease
VGDDADCFHGTHVAGIVAGRDDAENLRGVAPAAQILPIRVFNVSAGQAQAFDSDILAGLYRA